MATFNPNVYSMLPQASAQSGQQLATTFQNLMMEQQRRKELEQARLDKQRSEALALEQQKIRAQQELMQSPEYILQVAREGGEVSPMMQARYDIASAKATRTFVDPNTGQLVTTGGLPSLGGVPMPTGRVEGMPVVGEQVAMATPQAMAIQDTVATPDAMVQETEAVNLADPEAVKKQQEFEFKKMLAQAPNALARKELIEMKKKEDFKMREVKREESKQRKEDVAQSKALVANIKSLMDDKNLGEAVGRFAGGYSQSEFVPEWAKSDDQRRIQAKLNQLEGEKFLQAYQRLRGGGQITEVEGIKAQNAQAALNQSMNVEDYKRSLKEWMQVIENGIARSEGRKPPHNFEEEVVEEVQTQEQSLPVGATQIGTSGGKPVYQTPDGKQFMWRD